MSRVGDWIYLDPGHLFVYITPLLHQQYVGLHVLCERKLIVSSDTVRDDSIGL